MVRCYVVSKTSMVDGIVVVTVMVVIVVMVVMHLYMIVTVILTAR